MAYEKTFIQKAIAGEKVVVDICLGAQLIASVLGGKVYSNEKKEIGWFPVFLKPQREQNDIFNGFPRHFYVLHWHEDIF